MSPYCTKLTTLGRIRLQLIQPSSAVALNVTVFANVGGDTESSLTQKPPVLTSGAYDDTVAGVATAQITLGAGTYHVVPSTYNPGHEAGYKLIVYSSSSGVMITPV
jgi:calpain-7